MYSHEFFTDVLSSSYSLPGGNGYYDKMENEELVTFHIYMSHVG